MPGSSNEHDADRHELAGMYGITIDIRTLEDIGGADDTGQGSIRIGCDSISALRSVFWVGKEEISSKQSHFNLLSSIHGIIADLKLRIDTRHIIGHQDDVVEADLDRWTLLNIECHYRAKLIWQI